MNFISNYVFGFSHFDDYPLYLISHLYSSKIIVCILNPYLMFCTWKSRLSATIASCMLAIRKTEKLSSKEKAQIMKWHFRVQKMYVRRREFIENYNTELKLFIGSKFNVFSWLRICVSWSVWIWAALPSCMKEAVMSL